MRVVAFAGPRRDVAGPVVGFVRVRVRFLVGRARMLAHVRRFGQLVLQQHHIGW